MTQAARSGVQNIAEGSQASGTSKKFELKLTSVARSSLEELRLDYEDFLRQPRLPQWPRLDPRRIALIDQRPATADDLAAWAREARQRELQLTPSTLSTPSTYAEISANGVLALIAVASSVLDRQLSSLERAFVAEGGFMERLYRVRSARPQNARKPPGGGD
jgi:four helix bundle suffix protein